ncbi:hypothetical protein ABZ883_14265 [Streptomyces sp. NPDC046977]|uniref:hypothetical protein n=1 Tax=Streptomyces sp. NPDC046977 TaxID=3154703 RepID=UPI0033F43166
MRSLRRPLAGLLAVLALALTGAAAPASVQKAAAGTGSQVTVSGHDEFADLKLTVSQTKNLVNQVVKISWKGATPTISDSNYAADYLQIMQCWGDASTGPKPDQCQFGASSALGAGAGSQGAGAYTNTRQLNYGGLHDPAQTLPPSSDTGISSVPFHSVTGDVIKKGNWNEFYDVSTSNEVPYARSGTNGTGEVYFEVQTSLEAPGLGCGEVPAGHVSATGRSCWLVVVPRGETEVDGSPYGSQSSGLLQSSPLSATNWKQRIVVPLQFESIGNFCPIGADEVGTLGTEAVAEAVLRWQPALCQTGAKTIYGYLQATDDTARVKLVSDKPGMVFVSRPATADQVPQGQRPVYAPVALSGLTFGYFIESRAGFSAPDSVKARNGTRLSSLNLTARLVAKLLTESYQDGNSRFADSTKNNPFNLARDPEFQKYNPDYADLDFGGSLGDALVPEPLSDTAWELWNWVVQDPAAREFLDGTPDNTGAHGDAKFSGMTVNPHYKDAGLPVNSYPKNDPFCQEFPDHPDNPLCIQDKHPYASDMHAGARAVARGETLSRTLWDNTTLPPAYKKDNPQPAGQRAVLAVTDTATAHRYGLVTAALQNAAGRFVAPTDASLLAAQKAMKPSGVAGVLGNDPVAKDAAAYPIPLLSYAATVPENLGKKEGQEYADLLRYAVGPGQRPGVSAGTLPDGYVPLPQALRSQTLQAASAIVSRSGVTTPDPDPDPSHSSGGNTGGHGGSSGGGDGGSSGGGGAGDGGAGVPGPPADGSTPPASQAPSAPAGVPSGTSSGAPSATPVAAGSPLPPTPDWALGATRFALLIALVAGLVAAVCGPLLPRVAPRVATGLRALRTRGLNTPQGKG